MSFVLETKLLPDDLDSQTVCGNDAHSFSGMIPASTRSTPNSANFPATSLCPLIELSPARIVAWLAKPSAAACVRVFTVAPQHGGTSLATKHAPLATHVSTLKWTSTPPPR